MVVRLSDSLEQELRELAVTLGRPLDQVVEQAVREYLVAISMTDVTPHEVGEAQLKMLAELPAIDPWNASGSDGATENETR